MRIRVLGIGIGCVGGHGLGNGALEMGLSLSGFGKSMMKRPDVFHVATKGYRASASSWSMTISKDGMMRGKTLKKPVVEKSLQVNLGECGGRYHPRRSDSFEKLFRLGVGSETAGHWGDRTDSRARQREEEGSHVSRMIGQANQHKILFTDPMARSKHRRGVPLAMPYQILIRELSEDRNQRSPSRWTGRLGALAGLGVLLMGKTKYLLAALKLTKFASLFSMMATTATYAMFFGWPYALGFVGLIAVHEGGHALAMRYYNLDFSPAVFVPFMGAVIALKVPSPNAKVDAAIAIAGPITGSLGAAAVGVAGLAMDSQLLLALADVGLMINLFNLLPIGQLDGGRITGAISPYFLVAGLGIGAYMIFAGMIHNPIFYLIMLGGGWTAFERLYYPPPNPWYFRMNTGERVMWTSAYFGLIYLLIMAMSYVKTKRKSVYQLRQERGHEPQDLDPNSLSNRIERFAKETETWDEGYTYQSPPSPPRF